jgi:hypothetical protein
MKTKDYVGEEGVQRLRERFEQFLDSEDGGFIMVMTNTPYEITDVYRDICRNCVMENIDQTVRSADLMGLLSEHETTEQL